MSSSEFADDLATLSRLDNDILVDQLRGRYAIDDIYTYLGDILVAVNPYRPLPLYTEEVRAPWDAPLRAVGASQRPPLPPHRTAAPVSSAALWILA